ncbi:MAG: HD domain-containing protein [Gemmataceae bacterium]|nr:HD domain-containing protein [Gemmataceae bacterium]
MNEPRIVLAGLGSKLNGLKWESSTSLRIGRQNTADVVLRDFSVERLHAEIKNGGCRWVIRDLADDVRYPTLVNGVPLRGGQKELRENDLVQVGKVMIQVETLVNCPPEHEAPPLRRAEMVTTVLPTSTAADPTQALAPAATTPDRDSGLLAMRRAVARDQQACADDRRGPQSYPELEIQVVAHQSWDEALTMVATDRRPQQGQAMLTLLRANHHLCKLSHPDELLQSILADALAALGAQRGAILLFEPTTDQLLLRALLAPGVSDANDKGYSRTFVERCFQHGESILCQDVAVDEFLVSAHSVKQGSMSSVICALLRTPRRRLGVLHLDRGPLQEPFGESELYLADAIAASVAVGIECGQLVQQQREQFVETVATLARAVEMRDQHTGDHTKRVTQYALLLADELRLSQTDCYQLQIGTPLHDIGKIGIDDAILRKPGKLTPAEFEAMKDHTVKGAAIVESIASLNPIVPIVRHHHERWDGTGYPDKLGRDRIALTARIVAVADAFDAMTSHRPYRPAMPPPLAFLEILSKAGTHFDPGCVQAFLRLRAKIEAVLKQSASPHLRETAKS